MMTIIRGIHPIIFIRTHRMHASEAYSNRKDMRLRRKKAKDGKISIQPLSTIINIIQMWHMQLSNAKLLDQSRASTKFVVHSPGERMEAKILHTFSYESIRVYVWNISIEGKSKLQCVIWVPVDDDFWEENRGKCHSATLFYMCAPLSTIIIEILSQSSKNGVTESEKRLEYIVLYWQEWREKMALREQ